MGGYCARSGQRKNGFTLAELLIVVAIISVLTAVAIPVFTNQLERSREATDFANVRSAYAELMAEALTDSLNSPLKQADGTFKITVSPLVQKVDGWTTNIDEMDIGGVPSEKWTGSPVANGSCTLTFDPVTGVVNIDWGGEATSGGSSSSGSGSGWTGVRVVDPETFAAVTSDTNLTAKSTIRVWPNEYAIIDVKIGDNGLYFVCDDGIRLDVAPEVGVVYSDASNPMNWYDPWYTLDYYQTDGANWYRWSFSNHKWELYR